MKRWEAFKGNAHMRLVSISWSQKNCLHSSKSKGIVSSLDLQMCLPNVLRSKQSNTSWKCMVMEYVHSMWTIFKCSDGDRRKFMPSWYFLGQFGRSPIVSTLYNSSSSCLFVVVAQASCRLMLSAFSKHGATFFFLTIATNLSDHLGLAQCSTLVVCLGVHVRTQHPNQL